MKSPIHNGYVEERGYLAAVRWLVTVIIALLIIIVAGRLQQPDLSDYHNGYEDGKAEGYEVGYSDGYSDGYSAGYYDGDHGNAKEVN